MQCLHTVHKVNI